MISARCAGCRMVARSLRSISCLHLLPVLVAERIGPDEALGDPDRAQRKRVDLIDGGSGREDDLDAAAADVHHRGGAALEIEVPGGAAEGQLGLLVTGDDIDAKLMLPQDFPGEGPPVGRLPDRARGDRPDAR